jgi:hypothetical protein
VIYIEQPPFLPWLGYCEALVSCDVVALYDDVQFSERNVQNRNRIKTSSGVAWVTAPVHAGRVPIKDIRLADGFRAETIRRQLAAALGRAPRYAELDAVVGPALEGHDWLVDLNRTLILAIATALGSNARVVETSIVPATGADRLTRLRDICHHFGSERLWAGSGTMKYTSESDFLDHGITPLWASYEVRHPEYRQLWMRQGFVPKLSVVDAVANLGWAGTRAMLDEGLETFTGGGVR